MFLQSLRTDRYSLRHSSFPYFLNAAVFVKGAQKVKPGANSIAVWVPLCWLNPVCHPLHESKSPCKPTASSASTARNQSTPQPTRPGAPAPSGEPPAQNADPTSPGPTPRTRAARAAKPPPSPAKRGRQGPVQIGSKRRDCCEFHLRPSHHRPHPHAPKPK